MYTAKDAYKTLKRMNWRKRAQSNLFDGENYCATGLILHDAGVPDKYLYRQGGAYIAYGRAKSDGVDVEIAQSILNLFADLYSYNDNPKTLKSEVLNFLYCATGVK